MHASAIIDFIYLARPQVSLEVSVDLFAELRHMREDDGTWLWNPSPKVNDVNGTLAGYPVVIVDQPGMRLRYKFNDGSEHVEEVDMAKVGHWPVAKDAKACFDALGNTLRGIKETIHFEPD